MKKYLLSSVFAASILLITSALAQDAGIQGKPPSPAEQTPSTVPFATQTAPIAPAIPAQAVPPATAETETADIQNEIMAWQNSALWQAFVAVSKDLQPFSERNADTKTMLAQIDRFQFSPETKKKLYDLTGNADPLHVKSTKLRNGDTDLALTIDSLDFKDPKTGASAHLAEATGKAVFNKGLNKVHAVASLPLFHFESGNSLQVTAGDMSAISDRVRGPYKMWVGTGTVKLGHLTIDEGASKLHLNMDNLSSHSQIKPHGNDVDLDFDANIKSINWESDSVSDLHVAVRLANLSAKEIAAIEDKMQKLDPSRQSVEEQQIFMKGIVKRFGQAIKHGSAVEIQDVSAMYHGKTGGLNGRIAFDNLQDADLESVETALKKINVRLNFHIPFEWVTDVSRAITRKTMKMQNKDGQPVSDLTVESTSMNIVTQQMVELERKKWIRVEHDTILSSIEFKAGKLFINGQAITLPKSPAAPPTAPASAK